MIKPCRLCYDFEQDAIALKSQIEKYIASIHPEDKVKDEIYQQRLSHCDTCEALSKGLCRYCGCFVVVRAIKTKMECPNPTENRWLS